MDRKLAISQFYEQELRKFFEEDPYRGISGFKSGCQICGASISPENLPNSGSSIDGNEEVPIDADKKMPASVVNAFRRHIWYAKHNFSDISVLEITIGEAKTFAICINGYVDDGWDNSGSFIEIYDEQGQLMGATIVPCWDDEEAWKDWRWMERKIRGNDFNTPAPPWSQEEADERRGKRRKPTSDFSQLDSSNSIPVAFVSSYQPPNPIIYVDNLSDRATEDEVRGIFSEYGTVKQVHLSKDAQAGSFAFVEMTQEDQARQAVAVLDGAEWLGHELEIMLSQPPGSTSSDYSSNTLPNSQTK